jgi:hypothetical protein
MLRDVFYYGKKPNAHPREKHAKNLADARKQSTTSHFWVINEYCDYRNFDWDFDFEFLPDEDVWAEEHNNVWPSRHQKDSGTWLCPKQRSDVIIYRADVDPFKRKNEVTHQWKILENIDKSKWDFSWHPDPTDPPYIYRWGCKFFPVEFKTCLEYRVDGATEIKYMKEIVELLPNWDYIVENQKIDHDKFDMSWRPDPREPAYIYVWGNKWIDGKLKSTLEYHVPGATEKKYMPELLPVLPEWDKWVEHVNVNKSEFDFTWRPDPREPSYNYVWGNKYEEAELKPTLEYRMEGATQTKYLNDFAPVTPQWDRWKIIENIDKNTFDFTWRPDPREPALIYVFGNDQYDSTIMPTVEYIMDGATERKHINNWSKAKLLSDKSLFEHIENSDGIDYSWRPNPTSPPYIYAWGNQWNKPEDKISIQYVVKGATEYMYMEERAIRKPCMDNWEVPNNIDVSDFDFSWEPSPADPPFIYQFGTQWQKTGGPRYVVEGATEVKYVNTLTAKALPTKEHWTIPTNVDVSGFDFSWHPDDTSPAYIYHFATQWALTGGPVYKVEGATEVKYVEHPSAVALSDKTNWIVPEDVDGESFDFSWHPYVEDQPYIYQFGTQHQKTGGPRYVTPGVLPTSPTKYIDTRILKSKKLYNKKNFAILNNYKIKDFDWSWHPDDTEEPYIYVFGNNLYSAEIMPTIEYVVPGAKQIKYVNDIVATLDVDMTNWEVPDNIDVSSFDFTWKPNPKDPAYIYQFGTQWQKTGGPRYVLPDATEVKYIDTQLAKRLPMRKHFAILSNSIVENFDYSWHPDDTEEPYIYVFGNNQYPAEVMPTIEYAVKGATQIKYVTDVIAILGKDLTNWEIPQNVDVSTFDFTWKPNPKDPAYIYQFGTQWQKTGGPRYSIDGATEIKYIDSKVKALPTITNWHIVDDLIIEDFDYSWHPDSTEEPYIYVFGNNQYSAEIMPTIEYRMEGGTQIKYVKDIFAKLGTDLKNWEIPSGIDTTDFDFSWKPNPKDPAYIYQFGTQWQKTGGPRYVLPDANEVKYVTTISAKALPTSLNWSLPKNIDVTDFDFSWHPDDTSPAYIYHFATQWALTGGPIYTCAGATEIKYVEFPMARALPCKDNWVIPDSVDSESFDFSWHPYVEDQPYVYQFGTQWQKTGGPKYMTPGVQPGSPVKYIDTRILKATRLPRRKNFSILNNYKIKDFDYSWHPDETEEPYIYVFGNTQYPGEIMPTIEYAMPGAKQIKYVNDIVATLAPDKTNWEIPDNIDVSNFDFSWKPNPKDPPYIYQFGTQWQRSGGPRYVIEGATETKYVSTQHAIATPTKINWVIPDTLDISEFDFSWHPDSIDKPFIYQFGTQWALAGGPKYVIPGATEIKYIEEPIAKAAPNKKNWVVPDNVDESTFDFSWHPYIEDQPYIYQFGTQWQKTGGPKYYAPGADETSFTKYIDTRILKATVEPSRKNWVIPADVDTSDFDFSWHPDDTDGTYIYQFGTQWQKTGGPRYYSKNATDLSPVKYVDAIKAKRLPSRKNWEVPANIDTTAFDFSWHPDETEQPYNYMFPTVWQDEGGPIYKVPGANTFKYMKDPVAKTISLKGNWRVPKDIDTTNFDFTWHPHPKDPAFIYQFGTQHQKTGGPQYTVAGATQTKFIDLFKATKLPSTKNWDIPKNVDKDSFDFSWHPDNTEEPYIYQFGTNWSRVGGPKYIVKGATQTKFVDNIKAKIKADKTKWKIPNDIDMSSFDFSWQPDVDDKPYIYQFGTQWQKTGGPRYIAPNATEVKYIDTLKALRLSNKTSHWKVNIPVTDFDYSWHPDSTEEPYIYVFGNQWNRAEIEPTVEYHVEGATKIKYMNDIVAKVAPNKANWNIIKEVEDFDYSWRPDPNEPAYVYVFGNTQYPGTIMPTVAYVKPGALQKKYVDNIVAKLTSRPELFENTKLVSDFDYSWRPNPNDPPYIYQFGTQWAKTHGPRYVVDGATEIKYVSDRIAKILPDMTNWEVPDGFDLNTFDFSWHPDGTMPAYVYKFGTVLDDINLEDGPKYITPNHNNHIVHMDIEIAKLQNIEYPKYYIETNLEDLIKEHSTEIFWALQKNIDYTNFDFSWRPTKENVFHVNIFGSPESEATQTYFINAKMYNLGYTDKNYLEQDKKVDDLNLAKLFKKLDIFVVDRGNPEAQSRFEQLKARFGNVQKTRYLNTWVDTINRCINRSTTDLCWILNSELDYSDFDFEFYPNPWQMKMVHVFGTQWSHWGTTFVVNKETFANDTKYVKIIEHLNNLNFIKDKKALATNNLYDLFVIDHGNPEIENVMHILQSKLSDKTITTIKAEKTYLETFKNIVKLLPEKKDHYIWICSSVCDYRKFDFSYVCDPFAKDNLHVFPSEKQKFGDTFLVDVNKLRSVISDMEIMEDYGKINYNQHQRVSRLPAPVFITYEDTHFKNALQEFNFPYALFVTQDWTQQQMVDEEPMSLWTPERKNIAITSVGGTRIIVPDEVKNYVKRELYDYPYIKTNSKLAKSNPMDIVFLSNGESCAEENYQHLLNVTKGLPNRVVRVDGVNGRVNAYHAAAEASNTAWMFTVFAKLKVSNKFDWNWQPDRLQVPKHYIFHAKNPVNGLEYGHQAMIAYNKKLTLNNKGKGLDFTQDDEHEVVELLSGTAMFNTDAWSTWRTSFREVIKLQKDKSSIGKERLDAWLNKAEGDFADYSINGAKDAVEYYKKVKGNMSKLKLSYEWEWLKKYFEAKYK